MNFRCMTSNPPSTTQPDWVRDWLRDRLRASGRAQSRYLFLLLLTSAYTLGAHLTPSDPVEAPFLGLKVPRQLFEAFAVSLLAILTLAFFGSVEAMKRTLGKLAKSIKTVPETLSADFIEADPNLLDFLRYSTFIGGAPTWLLTPICWTLLYPLPLLGAMGWATWLWWIGVHMPSQHWPLLNAVHLFNGAILLLTLMRLILFLRDAWKHMRSLLERDAKKSKVRDLG